MKLPIIVLMQLISVSELFHKRLFKSILRIQLSMPCALINIINLEFVFDTQYLLSLILLLMPSNINGSVVICNLRTYCSIRWNLPTRLLCELCRVKCCNQYMWNTFHVLVTMIKSDVNCVPLFGVIFCGTLKQKTYAFIKLQTHMSLPQTALISSTGSVPATL